MVASLGKLDHLPGKLGETVGRRKQGAGLAISLPEKRNVA